jgi:DNA-binding CsgD family transcriptional regulator
MKSAALSSNLIPARDDGSHTIVADNRVAFASSNPAPERGQASFTRLTPRQLEVLALLCEGLPNKLICRQLKISAGTVKAHISGILRELGVASRLQAVVAARRLGLLRESAGGPVEPAARPASNASCYAIRRMDFVDRTATNRFLDA